MKRLAFLCHKEDNQFFPRFLHSILCGSLLVALALGITAQQPAPVKPAPSSTPLVPVPGPTPESTPTQVAAPGPRPTPAGHSTVPQASPTPSPFSSPQAPPSPAITNAGQTAPPLTLDEALRIANTQASAFQQAGLNERIAAEDVKQAQAAFLPKITAPIDYIFTSPLLGAPAGTPSSPSFIANNAVNEYQALVNVAGDIDIAGRLRATLAKNRALLAAAHAGTEVARRALAETVVETYYGLALAIVQRQGAEQNLAAAEEFERITDLLLSGGEVAPVDLTRAKLQTAARRDELERARGAEVVAAGSLRILVGYDFLKPISTTDLTVAIPVDDEVNRVTADMINTRPEFAQFEAERKAAEQEIRLAKAERRPQLSYSINGGFDTDSLGSPNLKDHSGVSAAVSLGVPIFDFGVSRSRERQARLRAQVAESQRQQALRTFAQQFYAARAQAISAAARIRVASAALVLAENNLNASIARYRAGEAQIVEVTDAQTILVTQRQALYQALFDYQVALARLRQATGR